MKTILNRRPPERGKEILNVKESAEFLGCNFRTMKKILATGDLPFQKVGGRFFISKEALKKWVSAEK